MKGAVRIFILFLLALAINSCVDEIAFDVDEGISQLAIEGQFSDSLRTHIVTVSQSTATGGDASQIVPERVPGATVLLRQSNGPDLEYQETEPGVHELFAAGQVGETYQLLVTLSDGREYSSNPHTIQPAVEVGSLETLVVEEEILNSNNVITTVRDVALETSGPLALDGNPVFTMFRVTSEFEFQEFYPMILNIRTCYIQQPVDFENVAVFSGEDVPGMELKNARLLEVDLNYEFFFNFGFFVEKYSIDRRTHEYWSIVAQLKEENQTIFAPPPGSIPSDFSNTTDADEQVLGFFTVGSVRLERLFTNINDLDASVFPLCQDPTRPDLPGQCFNCLTFSNSTLTKPPYWP